jgi:hypothetical protein
MRCQRCGKPISPLRQLTDQEFCSPYCRKRGPRASASMVRDLEFEDSDWNPGAARPGQKSKAASGASLGILLLLVTAVMVAGRMWIGDTGPLAATGMVADTHAPGVGNAGRTPADGMLDWLEERMPGDRPLRLRAEFSQGLQEWGREATWRMDGGVARPARLALWKPTMGKADYDLEFGGQIDQRAISWVFRAENEREYYASKIVLHRPGEISGASIHRYVVHGSEAVSRIELPLPVILQRNHPYQFTVAVKGNRFRTFIDGHVIDDWTDNRHRTGGVGFYSDPGEMAGLHWVSFRERRGLFERLLATALFLPPGMEF